MPDQAVSNEDSMPPPTTQASKKPRANWPEWMRQLPHFIKPPRPQENYQLISEAQFADFVRDNNVDAALAERIRKDMRHLDQELLPMFRARDRDAKLEQNRYRLYQISYIMLATVATVIGSLLALSLNTNPQLVPWLAFAETVVALFTASLAMLQGDRSPLEAWMRNRRIAEFLRREYFRYLLDLSPYDDSQLADFEREMLVSKRAAGINAGDMPEDTGR